MQQEAVAMEDYAAADERPVSRCLADVEKCDFYVGIFAKRYGFIPPNHSGDNPKGRSITELEYRHACEKKKKCFIFLVDGKGKWPLEQIEKGEGANKLETLCEELKLNHSVAFFKSEEELANEVSAAIFPHIVLAAPPQKLRMLQPIVAKMCDRRRQVSQFTDFFLKNLNERSGHPQVCFVHGEEGECHDSLVRRLSVTQIKAAVDDPESPFRGVATEKTPGWIEEEGEIEELQQELKRMLFTQFDPAYKKPDLSATALSKLAAQTLTRLVVLKHTISASRSTEATWRLVEWYLSYWAAIEVDISRPQFIIFFNIEYPKFEQQGWYKRLRFSRGFDKGPIKERLERICSNRNSRLPCLLLKEVAPLGKTEVREWFSEYAEEGNFSLELQQETLRTLFESDEDHKSMTEVEITLHRLVEGV